MITIIFIITIKNQNSTSRDSINQNSSNPTICSTSRDSINQNSANPTICSTSRDSTNQNSADENDGKL